MNIIDGTRYRIYFELKKENELSTLSVDSYDIINNYLSWLQYGVSPEAYNCINGDSIRTELNNMRNNVMDYFLEEFSYTTDIDLLSELIAKIADEIMWDVINAANEAADMEISYRP